MTLARLLCTVTISGPDGRSLATSVRSNPGSGTFTCEFTTREVGEHGIEVVLAGEPLNVTPRFYTYDASKVRVGPVPDGFVGSPVEFEGTLHW